jgi:hypothetical protein
VNRGVVTERNGGGYYGRLNNFMKYQLKSFGSRFSSYDSTFHPTEVLGGGDEPGADIVLN